MELKKKRGNSFTLLEVLICILILVTVGSFIGIKAHKLVGEFRLKKTLNVIESHVELCQKISLLQQHNITLVFQKEKKGFSLVMGSEGGLGFYAKTKPVKQTFENLDFHFPGKKNRVEFIFCSTGTVTPPGTIVLKDINTGSESKKINISNRYVDKDNPPPLHPFSSISLKENEINL